MIFHVFKNVSVNSFLKSVLKGDGNLYVLAILGAVMAGSYFLAGGIIPKIEREPENPEIVRIDPNKISSNKDSLQLINLVPLSPSPTPSPKPTVTPQLTPTVVPSQPPTPTETIQECYNNTLINLSLDYSASMLNSQRYLRLNEALLGFYNELKKYPNAVIGGQAFAGKYSMSTYTEEGVKDILTFRYVNDLTSSNIVSITKSDEAMMSKSNGGGTYMRNGFKLAKKRLIDADNDLNYDDYRKIFILFSDGIPETHWDDRDENIAEGFGSTDCYLGVRGGIANDRCHSPKQDPRGLLNNADLAKEIKTIADEVYVVGIFDSSNSYEKPFTKNLTNLLEYIPTQNTYPNYQFYDGANSLDKSVLANAFKTIFEDICN